MSAQQKAEKEVAKAFKQYFNALVLDNKPPRKPYDVDSIRIDKAANLIKVFPSENFCGTIFVIDAISTVESQLRDNLPSAYSGYDVALYAKYHQPLPELVPNYLRPTHHAIDSTRLWRHIKHEGAPWVKKLSRPFSITQGLEGKHLMIWPSHGRVYKSNKRQWEWQRPNLFCTVEDLLSQSIVVPYLFPMLEQAGAIVATCRERDVQAHSVVVDNDAPLNHGVYLEHTKNDEEWQSAGVASFAMPALPMVDGVNPFTLGTARAIRTTHNHEKVASATWCPQIPASGAYAVYVSYATLPNSTEKAHYTIKHRGGETHVQVNQQMGGSTWVYLGTYEFRQGIDKEQGVVLSNESEDEGVVTADAVRFGGGFAQYLRGEGDFATTSNLPAYFEAARYYTQFSGLPTDLYNTEKGRNDYIDDLRCRVNFTNYLAGGSVFLPHQSGLGVPLELCLAVHTDAGIRPDHAIYGALSIATTHIKSMLDTLATGISRMASADFAHILRQTLTDDLSSVLNTEWTRREVWNRNYCETREPLMPSAIIEMLSHQNFYDLKWAHNPAVKFLLARSLYKAILKYVAYQSNGTDVVVQPLPISNFSIQFNEDASCAHLSWTPTTDKLEPSACAKGYVVYTQKGMGAFDNGVYVEQPSCTIPLEPGVPYAFKITAVNEGGESFASEILTAYRSPQKHAPRVLMVNGFTKVSGPETIQVSDSLGFALTEDYGLPYMNSTAFCGEQLCFDTLMAGREGQGALGYSTHELEGQMIAGNTFNYTITHGQALKEAGVSYVSASRGAVEEGLVNLETYQMVDLIMGEQCYSADALTPSKTFTKPLIEQITYYLKRGGALFLTGSHIGKDMLENQERHFLSDILKVSFAGSVRTDSMGVLHGLNLQIPFYNAPSALHYPVLKPDVLTPACNEAFTAFAYEDYTSAGVAYPGHDYRVLTLAVPFDAISDPLTQSQSMKAIVAFLLPYYDPQNN